MTKRQQEMLESMKRQLTSLREKKRELRKLEKGFETLVKVHGRVYRYEMKDKFLKKKIDDRYKQLDIKIGDIENAIEKYKEEFGGDK